MQLNPPSNTGRALVERSLKWSSKAGETVGLVTRNVRRGRADVSTGTRYLSEDVENPVTLTDQGHAEVGLSGAIYEDLPAASSSPSLELATTLRRVHEIQRVPK